jgi:hypothetical protein
MNQLEHLRALRDKARIQTEQAKAVLKQQGEITESLDRLIAALEGKEDVDFSSRRDTISLAKGAAMAAVAVDSPSGNGRDREGGALVQMIAKLDKKNGEPGPLNGSNDSAIVWVDEVVPALPPIKKVSENRALPKLEPIVWEVANVEGYPVPAEKAVPKTPPVEKVVAAEAPPAVSSIALAVGGLVAEAGAVVPAISNALPAISNALKSHEEMGVKFKFLKFGAQPEERPVEVSAAPSVGGVEAKAIAPANHAMAAGGGSILSDSEVSAPPIPVITKDFSFVVAKDAPAPALEVIPKVLPPVEAPAAAPAPVENAAKMSAALNLPPLVVPPKAIPPLAIPPKAPAAIPPTIKPEVTEIKDQSHLLSGDTVPIPPFPNGKDLSSALSVKVNDLPEAVVLPVIEEIETPQALAPAPAVASVVSSNIFFDANSAYLKDSELTKLQAIAAAVSGSEARIVKIQGLEDLASSNDFKILLASRRVLAVKKKLHEKGVTVNQISVNEIRLSEDGRVLDPASISITPV